MSRTNTTPMAMVAMPAICRSRLVKFRGEMNTSSARPKMVTMRKRPTMIGSEPSSPDRTRTHHAFM